MHKTNSQIKGKKCGPSSSLPYLLNDSIIYVIDFSKTFGPFSIEYIFSRNNVTTQPVGKAEELCK